MMPVIRISDEAWERLKKWAEPLVDTPDDALRKVLDAADAHGRYSGASTRRVVVDRPREASLAERRLRGSKVPQQAFNDPILQSLYDLGGKGHASEVLPMVEQKMKDLLGDFDYQALPSGDIRWEKTANWARYWLTKRGFLRTNSARGVWELTDQGKNAAEEKKRKHGG